MRPTDVLAEATGGRHHDSAVRLVLLFPELLGTYGDGGNALILAKRLEWRGVPAEVITIEAGDVVPDSCDLYLLGGGEDSPQTEASRELIRQGSLQRAVDRGAAVFAVCAGMQILGTSFIGQDGADVRGVGLLDCRSVRASSDRGQPGSARSGEPRAVGELLAEGGTGLGRLTGFENHGSRTRLGPGARPVASVVAGVGNGDGTEGVVPADVTGGRVLGTYLHGPALARNPALADLLLGWVLDTDPVSLAPIDDREADRLRADRFRAVEAGHLDGVAHRSLRDRLLGRN